MRFRRSGLAALVGALAGLAPNAAAAADELAFKASSGQFLMAGFYPTYILLMKGLDPAAVKTEWIDKPYKGVIDIKDGPEKGQSVVIELIPTSQSSPNPQWCSTEGGEKFGGGGLTCLPGSTAKDQLRFRVKALYAGDLPKAYAGRTVAEYPKLPGRREHEVLGPFEVHVLLKE
jgi:hypothetical protein